MDQKIQSIITNVEVNDAVFQGENFQPTLINFFFGKNGTGKTTIAKTLKKRENCVWQPGVNADNIETEVYNEDFIRENVQSYGNIPGVFTITKQDSEAQQQINHLKAVKNERMKERQTSNWDELRVQKASDQAYTRMIENVWKKTREMATLYKDTQAGYSRDKKKFAGKLLMTKPVNHDKEEVKRLFDAAYGSEAKKYPYLSLPQSIELPDSELLTEQIVNRGDTPFSGFVKALNALPWIQQGHAAFHGKTDGKCPYCQQQLPDSFEADLASCYDEQYRRDIDALNSFLEQYRDAMNSIYAIFLKDLDTEFETPLIATLRDKLGLFVEKGQRNMALIKGKLEKPEEVVTLEDLNGILEEMNGLVRQINEKIKENNDILDNIDAQKQKITNMVWEFMAYDCQGDIAAYEVTSEGLREEIAKAQQKQQDLTNEINNIDDELKELNTRTTNTTVVMESINRELDYNGFQGFRLREKKGAPYVYELVRDDGTIADNLSEGERNIIAFLYFYHIVIGSQSDDGQRKDKIVVIDDPVSSMDSNSMTMVAQLIRNMINICYNNQDLSGGSSREDYIKQFFCLTHNPYFFQEITYNRISDYNCVSFYELRKDRNNVSTIIPCVADSHRVGGGEANYSPVKNYYDGLWYEYRNTDDPIAIVNCMKAIMEYFFIQMCRYTGSGLKEKLQEEKDEGIFTGDDYDLANAMLELLDTERGVMGDGVFFDRSQVDVDQCRRVFEKLFQLIGQDQHYQTRMAE